MSQHIVRRYDEELAELKKEILSMGGICEKMIADAMQSLLDSNGELARSVIAFDREVNRKEMAVDRMAVNILAKRQPVARDLRLLTMAMKVNTDLERIGDTAVNICERVLELVEEPPLKPYVDLPRMSALTQKMVKRALDSFVERDVTIAQEVIDSDDQIDDLYHHIFQELLAHMAADPDAINRAIRLLFIAKALERVADHATNIAEMVKYLVEGEDVRHLDSR